MDTKEKIIEAARELFNAYGYFNVTVRMIAERLDMSSGNLNYHFRRREDVLETLYFKMVSEFDLRIEELGALEITLPAVMKEMTTSMERMVEFSFFWTDTYNLLRMAPKIRSHFLKAFEQRRKGYQFLFEKLRQAGLMVGERFENEHGMLIDRMIGYGNTWLYESVLYGGPIDTIAIEKKACNLLSCLYPYLTDQGRQSFMEIHRSIHGQR